MRSLANRELTEAKLALPDLDLQANTSYHQEWEAITESLRLVWAQIDTVKKGAFRTEALRCLQQAYVNIHAAIDAK
jgi:hypothetical protein